MGKKIGVFILAVVFLAFASGCGSSVDKNLVGTWQEDDMGRYFIFTGDGKMALIDGDPEDIEYYFRYEASRGQGEYWHIAHTDIKTRFNYSVTGDTLIFDVRGGYSGTLTRVK